MRRVCLCMRMCRWRTLANDTQRMGLRRSLDIMLKRLKLYLMFLLVLPLLGAATLPKPVAAQSYSFEVPELQLQVYVQPDASGRLVYDITFRNYGSPIDIVDIGLPHDNYNIGNMAASINGAPLTDIRTSTEINIGVEIHLGPHAIPSGSTGTLHFEATMPDLVYQDTTDADYASLRITPTWFDRDSVQGRSEIRIAIHVPEGVEPDELRYQQVPYTNVALFQGRAVAIWEFPDERATEAHIVGLSFPNRVMDRVIRMTTLDLARRWLDTNPEIAVLLGLISVGLFAWLFFRFSGGTGCTVFVILAAALIGLFIFSPLLLLPAIPVLLALAVYNEVNLRKKTKTYLPPIAQVEGGGIKRGLTAPEAGVLLELPLHKILTLVVFGLLEKKLVELVTQDPLTVRVREPFRTWSSPENRRSIKKRRQVRRRAASAEGTVLHTYEDYFLDKLEQNPEQPVEKSDFTDAMESLLKQTAAKMKGFDLSDTQDYYRRVMTRAMEQAQAMGEVREREQYLDQHLPWVMMNDNYPTVLTHRGFHYWPMWARTARSAPSLGRGGPAPRSAPSGGGGGRTSFGDVAGSFAGWAETTMGGMAAAVLPGKMQIPTARGGFVNLSGVDRVTGDVFEALSKASSSSGGKGGGSSCACACAGCACACACAGGGR
jgi:hypothetical protein